MKTMNEKKATLVDALIPIGFLIVALIMTLKVWGGDPHMPILAAAIVAATIAMFRTKISWHDLEEGIVDTIKMSMGAILILMIIGMIIGTWILGGIVPTMIFYGLKILSPSIFLVAAMVLSSVVSLATGSSWTTAGTVGIALIGIGGGLGIPLPIVAGSIISGAYFGDKMSPLSDTTNLAPAVSGANLFDHIRHMLYTTGPSFLISMVIYLFIGFKYSGNNLDAGAISALLDGLQGSFTINLWMLLPPILVIAMVVLKVPAIPGLIGGTLLGGIFAWIFQGADMASIIDAAHYGFVSETGLEALDELLTRGGLNDMMWTISLILVAMTFGGIMERAGFLQVIAEQILKFATNTGNLVLSTILTVIAMNMFAGDQYLSIVVPGRMYKPIFDERNLHPKNLSRVLEDAGTLTSPLIPWNSCGIFMAGTLGVSTFLYAPFAFLNIINPLISIFYGYTGITMETMEAEEKQAA